MAGGKERRRRRPAAAEAPAAVAEEPAGGAGGAAGAVGAFAARHAVALAGFAAWLLALWGAAAVEFGGVFVLGSIVVAVWRNLSDDEAQPGQLSAYAAFNDGALPIPGTLTAQQVEAALRHKTNARDTFAKGVMQGMRTASGRLIGPKEPCPCGSKRKFKKCCGRPVRDSDSDSDGSM